MSSIISNFKIWREKRKIRREYETLGRAFLYSNQRTGMKILAEMCQIRSAFEARFNERICKHLPTSKDQRE